MGRTRQTARTSERSPRMKLDGKPDSTKIITTIRVPKKKQDPATYKSIEAQKFLAKGLLELAAHEEARCLAASGRIYHADGKPDDTIHSAKLLDYDELQDMVTIRIDQADYYWVEIQLSMKQVQEFVKYETGEDTKRPTTLPSLYKSLWASYYYGKRLFDLATREEASFLPATGQMYNNQGKVNSDNTINGVTLLEYDETNDVVIIDVRHNTTKDFVLNQKPFNDSCVEIQLPMTQLHEFVKRMSGEEENEGDTSD